MADPNPWIPKKVADSARPWAVRREKLTTGTWLDWDTNTNGTVVRYDSEAAAQKRADFLNS